MHASDCSGWLPNWAPAAGQIQSQRSELRRLVGARVADGWIVWNHEHDEWFADLPVVIRLEDGRQLEVSWQKFDELSVTWNTVDVSVAPTAWVTWPLSWRSAVHPALVAVTGKVIAGVAATEHLFTTRRLHADGREDDERGQWLTGGLWLETDGHGLHIFNALDENGLSNEAADSSGQSRLVAI